MLVLLTLTILGIHPPQVSASGDYEWGQQTIIYAIPYPVEELSHWGGSTYFGQQWTSAVYSGLYSPKVSLSRLYGPELAMSMPSVSEDGLVWTVDLGYTYETIAQSLPKVPYKFDNGNPITAQDVVFSYQVALTPAINHNSYMRLVDWFASNDSIIALDDNTVEFTFTKPTAFALELLSSPIIDKSFYGDRYDDCLAGNVLSCDWDAPVEFEGADVRDSRDITGTAGPYSLEHLDPINNYVEVIKNFNYWNQEHVWADTIVFQFIETKEEALSELSAGNIDIMDYQYYSTLDDFTGLTSLEIATIITPNHQEIALNHLHPYFGTGEAIPGNGGVVNATSHRDARLVREAMSHVVDRQFIIENLLDELAEAAASPLPPVSLGWDATIVPHTYDVLAGRALMEQAGFDFSSIPMDKMDAAASCGDIGQTADCFFNITVLSPNTNLARNEWAAMYVEALPKIGIGVQSYFSTGWDSLFFRIFGYPLPTLIPTYEDGGYDIFFVSNTWGFDWDPRNTYNLEGLCDIGDCSNYLNYVNDTVDDMIKNYKSETNQSVRLTKAADLQAVLAHQLPIIPIIHPKVVWSWDGQLIGLDLVLLGEGKYEWTYVRQFTWTIPAVSTTDTTESDSTSITGRTSFWSQNYVGVLFPLGLVCLVMLRRRR